MGGWNVHQRILKTMKAMGRWGEEVKDGNAWSKIVKESKSLQSLYYTLVTRNMGRDVLHLLQNKARSSV